MSDNTFLGKFAKHCALAVRPLTSALSDEQKFIQLLREMGWAVTNLPASVSSVTTAVNDLITHFEALPPSPTEGNILDLINDVKAVYTALNSSITTIASDLHGITGATSTFISEFPKKLLELLAIKYLNKHFPDIYGTFTALSVIEITNIPALTPRPFYTRYTLNYATLLQVVTNPENLIKAKFGWNASNYDFSLIQDQVSSLLSAAGIPAAVYSGNNVDNRKYNEIFDTPITSNRNFANVVSIPIISAYIGSVYKSINLQLIGVKGDTLGDTGFALQCSIPTGFSNNFTISDTLTLHIDLSTAIGNSLAVLITPNGIVQKFLMGGSEVPEMGVRTGLSFAPETPQLIFGRPDGTRLELRKSNIVLAAQKYQDGAELNIDADLSGLALIIDPSDADGFISKIFGDSKKEINIPLVIRWSSIKGITFMSAAAFEIKIPSNVSIGPINIRDLTVAIKAPTGANKVTTNIGANISGTLGPVSFLVENVGLAANIDTNGGNVGPFGVGLGFKPPTGIAIGVDAGIVSGGGYLKIDTAKGLYAGAVELSIKKTLSIVGIGVVTTKNPDGSKGYSMLMMVTCTFSPSIPIGFGFNLSGVGGLVGINRDMNPDAIREGVRNGGIDKVMFPENVVENIDGIIQNLQAFFPQAHGRYVAGLLFKITWGPAVPLITINLGLVVNFPEPIRLAVLGTVRVALPDPNAPLLELNVAFAGVIDFDRKYLAFDASLYNSRLLFLQLSGDMCVRLFWGEHKEMLFSAGGFHPSFNPPADLMLPANMKRLSMSVLDNDALKLTFSTYFAITSNTVQFGANVKVDFNAVVRIRGEVGFDVLFHFNPFSFQADAYGSASLSISKFDLMAMNFVLKISGPEQWQVQGSINYSFLNGLVKGTGRIDKKWPSTAPLTIAPSYIALGADVLAALNDNKNWKATLPEVQQLNVKIKEIPDTDLVIMPMGLLSITQKVAPMGFKIQRYGTKMLSDDGMYNITSVTLGSGVPELNMMYEVDNFASGQFMNMSDAEKLKAPSFEYYKCGVKVAVINDNPWSGLIPGITVRVIEYHKIIIDKKQRKKLSLKEQMNNFMVNAFVAGGRVADSKVTKSITAIKTKPVANTAMLQEKFKFVTSDGLVPPSSTPSTIPLTLTYNSKAEALSVANALGSVSANNVLLVPSYLP